MQLNGYLRRLCACGLLKIYMVVLGALLLHVYTDTHHQVERDHVCHTEVHYHQTSEDCSLASHTLAPMVSFVLPEIGEQIPQHYKPSFAQLAEGEVYTHYLFYRLRAPPTA